jgi:peptidoglycan/xylan/chitin deacetylase (PgdA/CDA1 family)
MFSTTANLAARSAAAIVPGVVGRLPVSDNRIFLTFDDGPSRHTGKLLDLLSEAGASATFFLQGNQVDRHPSAVGRIIEAGHGLGNHSFSHLDAWRNAWAKVEDDLDRGSESIAALAGAAPLWMRPPYGRFRPATLRWCSENNQRLALWDIMAPDFLPGVEPEGAAARVLREVRSGSILVLHDGDVHQPKALKIAELVISGLIQSGWSIDRLPASI